MYLPVCLLFTGPTLVGEDSSDVICWISVFHLLGEMLECLVSFIKVVA